MQIDSLGYLNRFIAKHARNLSILLSLALIFLNGGFALKETKEINASDIVNLTEKGKNVTYNHVVIRGDLDLSKLDLPIKRVNRSKYEIGTLGIEEECKSVASTIIINDSRINGHLIFNNIVFEQPINFQNTKFNKTVNLKGSKFNSTVDFQNTKFNDTIDLVGSKFDKLADFDGSNFLKEADLRHSNFTDSYFRNCKFFNGAIFADSIFSDRVDFSGTQFYRSKDYSVDFINSKFIQDADFIGTIFKGTADFPKSTFQGYANFMGSFFSNSSIFKHSRFLKKAYFMNSIFSESVDFTDSEFNNTADFSNSTFLESADFVNTTFRDEEFYREQDNFIERIRHGADKFLSLYGLGTSKKYISANFNRSNLNGSVKFLNSYPEHQISFEDAAFSKLYVRWNYVYHSNNLDFYPKFIDNYKKINWFEDMNDCYYDYRLEIRKNVPWDPISLVFDVMAEKTYGYGSKLIYPFIYSFMIIVFFAYIFHRSIKHLKKSIANSLIFSLTVFLSGMKFLNVNSPKEPKKAWLKNAFNLEKALGLIFQGLIVLSITKSVLDIVKL